MANANTNLMSISSSGSAKSASVNSQSSTKYKTATDYGSKKNFGTELDKANTKVSQNDSEKFQSSDSNFEQVKAEAEATDKALKASSQGQNKKMQDAPQQENSTQDVETVAENFSSVEEKSIEVEDFPSDLNYYFVANINALLTNQNADATSTVSDGDEIKIDTSLMTVMPQETNKNSRTMLDLLGGKTWTSSDVETSISQQNQKVFGVNQQVQVEIPQQNLNPQQVQVEIPQQNLNPQQVQAEIPQQNLNPQQVQAEIPQQNLNPQQVQAEIPQQNLNPQQVQVEIPQQNLNLNQQLQVEIPQQNLNLNQQLQVEIPQQNLNPQQVQVEIPQQNLNPQQVQVEIPQQNLNPQQVQIEVPQQNLNPQQVQVETPQQQFAQEISPVVNSIQSQVEAKPIQQNQISAEMNLENLQVEENQPTLQNIPVQQIPKQFEQQSDNQNFQQLFNQNSDSEVQNQSQNFSTGGENFTAHLSSVENNSSQIQQTTQTQAPETAQQTAREDFNVPAQIVEQARMIRRAENTEMVINLKPEHLGSMTLKITVNQNGALNATFYSDNAQVRAIIENSLVQLKQELSDQGLKVENVEVYAGLADGGLMNGQGQQAWQQNQQQGSRRSRIDFSKFEDEVDSTQPMNNSTTEEGVDYKV